MDRAASHELRPRARELPFLLSYGTHLPIRVIVSNQTREIIERTRSFMARLQAQVVSLSTVTTEMHEALAKGRRLLEDRSASTPVLIDAQMAVISAWRSQKAQNPDDDRPYQSPDKPESELFQMARSIDADLFDNCEQCVADGEAALHALRASVGNFPFNEHMIDRRGITASKSAFLSYAREDANVVQTVRRQLVTAGVETWLDTRALAGGSTIPIEIASAIRNATHFLVFQSIHSRNSAWVARESSLAISQEIKRGAPRIVPLLIDSSPLPDHLVDRSGINFEDFSQGMRELWSALGVPQEAVWSISEVNQLQRRFRKLLESVVWCGQADSFLSVGEDTFSELEEAEAYVIGLALEPGPARFPRFLRTGITYSSAGPTVSFEEEYYTFQICYCAGVVLLRALTDLSNQLVSSSRERKDRMDGIV